MFSFIPMNFITNLKYMGIGMLGVFMIIGVIIIATVAINAATSAKSSDKE